MCVYLRICVCAFSVHSYFLAIQDAPGSACIFPTKVYNQSFSQKISGSFYWRKVLEIKVWVLGVLTAAELSFLLDPLSWNSKKICLYSNTCTCTWP